MPAIPRQHPILQRRNPLRDPLGDCLKGFVHRSGQKNAG